MNRYIDQLFQVGCVEGSPEELAVGPLVRQAWDAALALRRATGASTAQNETRPLPVLELIGESEAKVWARGKALVSGLAEVMLNAIEAAPDAKAVRVTLDETRRRLVGIVVHDDGAGISTQALAMLGQPFQGGKTYGFGLGYSVLRAALADCDGAVEYGRSKQLKGAMCAVVLPIAKAENG
jgi:C4-dicarboxylate-specific signal transduction histidine kinase